MDATARIVKMIAICCVCNIASHAEEVNEAKGPDSNGEKTVSIGLVKLEVTGSSLGLSYEVRNGSARDVWVCSEVSSMPFEIYLTQDKQTLLIRKRLDVPSKAIWASPPTPGTYVRLGPGANRPESVLIDLPVKPNFVYAPVGGEAIAQTVRRVALEIGYYDEDLPTLVRSICAVADELSAKGWGLGYNLNPNTLNTYFRGLIVRGVFAGSGVITQEPYTQAHVYVPHSRQALTGERVLRIEVNGVSIPYRGRVETGDAPRFTITR
jgi:hypothetical protein